MYVVRRINENALELIDGIEERELAIEACRIYSAQMGTGWTYEVFDDVESKVIHSECP